MTARTRSTRLFFVHIPKCAGSTMDYLLRFQFGIGAMNVRDDPPSERVSGNNLDFARRAHPWFTAASGHGLYLDQRIKARYPGSFWFTILREPRARYISHHAYLQQKKGMTESLLSWAERGAMRNLQVRWLAGEENLSKAIDAMETTFDFIGRLDAFERSLTMVAQASGIELSIPKGYKKNTTRLATPQLSTELSDLIDANNDLDLQLWTHFEREIWPKQVAQYPDSMLETREVLGMKERINIALNMLWRGTVYLPLLRARHFLTNATSGAVRS